MKAATSSETQGQLVRTIECPWWKFTIRSRGAPGHLLLLNQIQKHLNCLLLIGKEKKILANQRRGAAGDCGVFLHNIGFLIDHHCCVVHLTGEVSGGKFQKKTVNKAGKVCKGGGAGNVCKGVESGSHASRISNKNLRYLRQIHLKIHRRLLFLVAVLKLAFFPAS